RADGHPARVRPSSRGWRSATWCRGGRSRRRSCGASRPGLLGDENLQSSPHSIERSTSAIMATYPRITRMRDGDQVRYRETKDRSAELLRLTLPLMTKQDA